MDDKALLEQFFSNEMFNQCYTPWIDSEMDEEDLFLQKHFSFERFLKYFKATTNSEKKKTRSARVYEFYEELYCSLKNKTYKPKQYGCFFVSEPKVREIFSPNFDDRVMHHLVVGMFDGIEKYFIDDSFANRIGKGTHRAVDKAQYYMRQIPQRDCYYMQCDIKSYFTSINKHILFKIIFQHMDNLKIEGKDRDLLVFLLNQIVLQNPAQSPIYTGNKHLLKQVPPHKSLFHQKPHKGLPIGSLTSQFFSLIYLNELDQFVKNELGIKRYVRYVDDFVIFEDSTKNFHYYEQEISKFLKQKLDLELHPNKTHIQHITKGLDFLGYIIRPHYLLVRNRTVSSFKNRLRFFNWLLNPNKYDSNTVRKYYESLKLSKAYGAGLVKPPIPTSPYYLLTFQQVINSYYGIFAFGNSYNLRVNLYKKSFEALKEFFYPKDYFRAFGIRKNALMGAELATADLDVNLRRLALAAS